MKISDNISLFISVLIFIETLFANMQLNWQRLSYKTVLQYERDTAIIELSELNWTWNPLNLPLFTWKCAMNSWAQSAFLCVKLIPSFHMLLSSLSSDDFPNLTPLHVGNGFNDSWLNLIFMYPFIHLFCECTESLLCRGNTMGSSETMKEESQTLTFTALTDYRQYR